jgi:hypothetical protein
MSDTNHRRKNRKAVNQRYDEKAYHNGYAQPQNKEKKASFSEVLKEAQQAGAESILYKDCGAPRVGRTDYLDKSMHGWGRKSEIADKSIGAGIGNDFSNGHRGMARAVAGAKKFVRSRIRFHENQATKKLNLSDE